MEPVHKSRPTGFDIRPAAPGAAERVNDFIHLSQGLSNSFLLSTADGRIVVNTGMGFEAAIHKEKYDAVDPGPTRYIILTQGHVDHVGGVDHFRDPGTDVVAQANNRAQQADDARIAGFRAMRSYFAFAHAIDAIARHARGHDRPQPAQSIPLPTILFDDRLDLEVGGLRLELLSVPGGETTDSLAIWLPQHAICFTGNLFSALFGHFPNLVTIRGDRYREAPRFLESLERVRRLEPEMLLVGHHQPVVGRALIQNELLRLRDAVAFVHDKTVEGMNAGVDVRTLMREIVLPPELRVGEGYGKVAWSVRAIWENYAGWFHHRSTTELYAESPASIAADLVELAGADAIAERAAQHLADDQPLRAIHLCEAVRVADPRHARATEVYIDAHERLLHDSVNFWETQWLNHQIRLARKPSP